MSLWDYTVGRELQSEAVATKQDLLCRFAMVCAERAVQSCSTQTLEPHTADRQHFLNTLAEALRSCISTRQSLNHLGTQPLISQIEFKLDDPDQEDSVGQCWYCSLESALYAFIALREPGQIKHALAAADAAYRCCTDQSIQAEMRRRGCLAINENELREIEGALEACRNEIQFQLDLLAFVKNSTIV